MSTAYYNEFDPKAAAVLRELIKRGVIAPGVVDERDIRDIRPVELDGFTQCHFFAGYGVWSYALRRAGVPDDFPWWTASCPCQPFSAAGKRAGFADERHLWPAFFHLLRVKRPGVVSGEQVASKDGLAWLDTVQADLEAEAYTVAPIDLCSAGFGASDIRQRLYWVADTDSRQPELTSGRWARPGEEKGRRTHGQPTGRSNALRMDDPADSRCDNARKHGCGSPLFPARSEQRSAAGGLGDANDTRPQGLCELTRAGGDQRTAGERGIAGGMADTMCERRQQDSGSTSGDEEAHGREGWNGSESDGNHLITGYGQDDRHGSPGPTNGFWRAADWLRCRDGRWRPVEPGTFPLASRAPARVGRLRGYGNCLNAEVAKGFIESYCEARGLTA